ncbi:hypothetical protein Zmor_024218 [Zophobas morio]|uniref:Uncharacterized protein n=1 Tax=Zophobas morio TaxID=2755281 RepID=A0AA38M7X1_9CUCU|nr:hypothetical protein Zmor_024218 [Zophobas morio]
MCSNADRQNYAKKIIQGKGRDVIAQRTDRRQRLIQRFKSLRIQSIDSLRHLNENEITYEVLSELKKLILSTLDQGNLLHEDDVDFFLKDLEEELKLGEHEQYEKLCMEEIESITNNLMGRCDICENLIINNGICDSCSSRHFTAQF